MVLAPPPGFDPIYNSSSDVPGSGTDGSGSVSESGSDPKRPAKRRFDRVFSKADEIALLKGMIEFAETYKFSPLDDLYGFLDFLRPSLECDTSKVQLEGKISKFRWKCIRNLVKERLGGDNARRLKAHEQRAFDLSKLVWSNPYIGNENFEERLDAAMKKGVPKKKKKKNAEMTNKKNDDEAMEAAERKKIQDEKLEIAKLKIFYKKVCLIKTQLEIVMDVLENNQVIDR